MEDDFFGAKPVSGSAASRRRMLGAPCGTRTLWLLLLLHVWLVSTGEDAPTSWE
jgi:hypothetical protein